MPVEKRANEWSILRTVYDVNEFEEILESERPDFVLRRASADPFGVEVTELFATESDARTANHPQYLAELFEGGDYKHKADKKLLPVARVRISDAEGNVKQEDVPAVFTPTRPESEHRARIAEVIRAKADRGYEVDGTHLNLIIRDRFHLTGEDLDEDYSVTELLSDGIREALTCSPFREVYLVSVDRTGEQVVRPLIQLMLAEQFFAFGKAAEATLDREGFDKQWMYVQAFAQFSEHRGMSVSLHEHRGHPVAAHRSGAIGLGENWGMELLDLADYGDSHLPEWRLREGTGALSEEELARCSAFVDTNEFIWGYYGTAKEQADLPLPHVRTVYVTQVTDGGPAPSGDPS